MVLAVVFRLHQRTTRTRFPRGGYSSVSTEPENVTATLIGRKKAAARAAGSLGREVCGFDFEVAYGSLGHDFIECHHLRPLSDSGPTKTHLGDLALLCSNCHRMAHRGRPWPSLGQLKSLVSNPPQPVTGGA